MVDVAEVKIWGSFVGAILWDIRQKVGVFEYDQSFIQKGWDLSPIKMPISNGSRINQFPELRKAKGATVDTFKGLPGLLADALPDRYGNQLINVWLAQQGRPANSMNPVEQLCFIGSRGMGALSFEPAQIKGTQRSQSIAIDNLVRTAHQMLTNKESFATNLHEDEVKGLRAIIAIGTSAGGARPKAIIAYNEKTGEVRSGQTNAPIGFEHWLLKLDGVSDTQFGESSGWGRVEFAYHLMARACRVEMMECKLIEENGRAHFMTKRFDRAGGKTRHHIQTLCGIQHFDYNNLLGYSYEQIFQTMRTLRLDYEQAEQMFRRMVFNVIATNCDDHTKNFSFRLRKGHKWELSPAYDVCYSFDPTNIWVNQQTLSINGKHKSITEADMLIIAKANSIKRGKKIIDEINTVVKTWETFADQARVKEELKERIKINLKTF